MTADAATRAAGSPGSGVREMSASSSDVSVAREMSASSSDVSVAREWYDIVTQFSYDLGTPYRAGQHRGVTVNVRGGEVRSLVEGRVVFVGRVVQRNVVVVLARDARGREIRSTYVGLDAASARVGQTVHRGDVVGRVQRGHTIKLGLRDAYDRTQYLQLRAATLTQSTLAPNRTVPQHVTVAPTRVAPQHVQSRQVVSGSDSIGGAVVRQLTHLVLASGSKVGHVNPTYRGIHAFALTGVSGNDRVSVSGLAHVSLSSVPVSLPLSLLHVRATSVELTRASLTAALQPATRYSPVTPSGPRVDATSRTPMSSASSQLGSASEQASKLDSKLVTEPVESRISESFSRSAHQAFRASDNTQLLSRPAQDPPASPAFVLPPGAGALTSAQLGRSAQEMFGGSSTNSSVRPAAVPAAAPGGAASSVLGHWYPWSVLVALILLLIYRRRQRRRGASAMRVPTKRELMVPDALESEFELAAERILHQARSRDVSVRDL